MNKRPKLRSGKGGGVNVRIWVRYSSRGSGGILSDSDAIMGPHQSTTLGAFSNDIRVGNDYVVGDDGE